MENKYKVNYKQYVDGVDTTFQLNTSGTVGEVCEPNTEWTGIPYAGTSITNLNECAYLSWGNDYQSTSIGGKNLGRSNLRFAIIWYSSGTSRDVSRFAYRWTGLPESIVNYYKTNDRFNVQLFNPLSNNVGNVGTLGVRSPWYISFLNELKINNLIFNVVISVSDLKFSGYRSGEAEGNTSGRYYSTITESNKQYYNWKDIRAEDNFPEGLAYDDDLWNNGYKVLAQDSDSITYRIVKGATLIPYYGYSSNTYNSQNDSYTTSVVSPVYGDRQNFGIIASSSADSPTFNSNTRSNPRLIIIADGVGISSTIYHSVNGIKFNNSSSIQIEYGLNQSGIQQWTRGTDYLGSNDFNVANQLYDSGTNNGGIIEEFLSATPTGHVLVPGIKGGGGTLSTDNDTWGDSASSVFRYIPVLESTGSTIALCYRKSYAQCATLGCVYPIKELWQTIATFGCYVGDDEIACQKAQLGVNVGDNNHIYLGEMLQDGTTTGNMLQGGAISNSIQANIDDIIADTPYTPPSPSDDDPTNPPTPSGKGEGKITGDTTTGIKDRFLGTGSIKYYALAPSDTTELKTLLWAQAKTFYEAIQIAGRQSASIFDYISSFRYYPASVSAMGFTTDSASNIYLGTGAKFQKTDGTDYQLVQVNGFVAQFDWCSWDLSTFSGWRNNFLDYSPYCKLSIYLPYAGTFDLDLQTVAAMMDITQATIRVSVCIDINTGSMTYYVDADNCMVLNKTVKLGVDLPISGNDAIQQSTAILQTTYNNASQLIGEVSGIASAVNSGSVADIATSALQLPVSLGSMSLSTALANRQVPTQVSSFGGALSSVTQGQDPYITIYRQKIANPLNYGHTVGYLTDSTHAIGDLSGWTICSNPDLSGIAATTIELDMIQQILTSGFYA